MGKFVTDAGNCGDDSNYWHCRDDQLCRFYTVGCIRNVHGWTAEDEIHQT